MLRAKHQREPNRCAYDRCRYRNSPAFALTAGCGRPAPAGQHGRMAADSKSYRRSHGNRRHANNRRAVMTDVPSRVICLDGVVNVPFGWPAPEKCPIATERGVAAMVWPPHLLIQHSGGSMLTRRGPRLPPPAVEESLTCTRAPTPTQQDRVEQKAECACLPQ
jgi:hypothetical protein